MKSASRLTFFYIAAVLACVVLPACTDYAASSTRVNVMPNRQVRQGAMIHVFGNAGKVGGGSANGDASTWSFSANPNVRGMPVFVFLGKSAAYSPHV